MDLSSATERRALSNVEFDLVRQSHHLAVRGLCRNQLGDLPRRVCEQRDRARDISRRQRRELRAKSEPRGAVAGTSNSSTNLKAPILVNALTWLKDELARHAKASKPAGHTQFMHEAMGQKRSRVRHRPAPEGTPGQHTPNLAVEPRPARADTA